MTRQKRAEKVFSTLSRTSSTASLLNVKIEEPPFVELVEERDADDGITGKTSARLLFGRPPIKKLLRRSTRTAFRESISYRFKDTLKKREHILVGRQRRSKSIYLGYLQYFLFIIALGLLVVSSYDTVSNLFVAFHNLEAQVALS